MRANIPLAGRASDGQAAYASRTRPANKRRSGITLIEVLAAMAIFMIALVSISQLVDAGSNTALEASRVNIGTRLAQSKMAEVEAGVIPIQDGGSGTFENEAIWQWEVTPGERVASNTYQVTVRCYTEGGRNVEIRLTQVIFDPYCMGNASEAAPPALVGASQ